METVVPDAEKTREDSRTCLSLRVLQGIFAVLFLQAVGIVLLSLAKHQPVPAVHPLVGFEYDYNAFYLAAQNWIHGLDPYLHDRFLTPPFSLWAGLLFSHFNYDTARVLYFVLNLTVLTGALIQYARSLRLTREATALVLFIAMLYQPFLMILERGNVDGYVVAALMFVCCFENWATSGVLLGAATATKLYPALLWLSLARKRQWKTLAACAFAFVALNALFLHAAVSSIVRIRQRANVPVTTWNLSPAALFVNVGAPSPTIIFGIFWALSLIFVLLSDKEGDWKRSIWRYVPWMASFPSVVYLYCGVLFLPLFMQAIKAAEDRGRLTRSDWVMLLGFCCVGASAPALSFLFPGATGALRVLAPAGTTLIMTSVVLSSATQSKSNGRPN